MSRQPGRDDDLITSGANPLVKEIVALRRSNRRRRRDGVTIVEGYKILELALDAGYAPVILLFDRSRSSPEDLAIVERAHALGATVRAVSVEVLAKASMREGPMGCVASVHIAEGNFADIAMHDAPLVLVMEGLEKPGNLGALTRTASAAGADALIAADSQTDIFAPATVHASLGAVFDLPVIRCTTAEALEWLRESGIEVVAASPGADRAYYEVDLTGPVAIAVGNEHRGLSDPWLRAGVLALIPMSGPMNSLNATAAGGIVLFEAIRQRAVRHRGTG